jgi:tetratricopeptide (TPR) repeat protein
MRLTLAYQDADRTKAAIERAVAHSRKPLLPAPDGQSERDRRDTAGWSFRAAVELEAGYEKAGNWDNAQRLRSLSYTLHGSQEPAEVELSRGKLLDSLECHPPAIDAYRQAMAADHPRWSAIAAYDLGVLLLRLGSTKEALAAFEAATAADDRRIAQSARSELGRIRRSRS